jgi:hydrogenase maturation protease HycI
MDWQARLQASLNPVIEVNGHPRLAVVGIGHELCGDDAVGLQLAIRLRSAVGPKERLLVVEAGPAPENFTGPLRRFRPDLVLLVDAAQMDGEPGAIAWVDPQEAGGISASTHTLPLHLFAGYLQAELGCAVALIGIQPAQTFSDAPLTPGVREAAEAVVRALVAGMQSW